MRLFGHVGVCVYQILASFSSLWPAVTLSTSTHCQNNESVHRKEEHASSINTIPLKNIDFIDVGNFEVANFHD